MRRRKEDLTKELFDINKLRDDGRSGLEANFLQEKAKFEDEMRQLQAKEQKRLEELTLVEINKVNKIKEEAMRLVFDMENSMTNELTMAMTNVFASTIGVDKLKAITPQFDKAVRSSLQTGVLKLLKNSLDAEKIKSNKMKITMRTWKPFSFGVLISLVLFVFIPYIFNYVKVQNDPVKQQLDYEAKMAKIPKKIFTPQKVSTLGATFVDSVIYTENYVETVSTEKFRSELMKSGSVYLYKQWQINEEESIKAFAMIFSMIDLLKDRSAKIDPDNEKSDIDKLIVLEKETMKKLEEILGNPVRLEAALKFYNRYYGTFTPSVPPIVESTFTPE